MPPRLTQVFSGDSVQWVHSPNTPPPGFHDQPLRPPREFGTSELRPLTSLGELLGSVQAYPRGVLRSLVVVAIPTVLTAACGRPRVPTPLPSSDACMVTASSAPVDSASVVVTSPVNVQNAPRPTTWGERFVFALADTAAKRDCRDRPLSNVAGPYGIRDVGRSTLQLEPVAGARGPRLTIHLATETSARDLVDAGVDLLVTDSPALAAYAATRGDVTSAPLGWDRTWVVATPSGSLAIDSSVAFRSGLARDAVRADARASEGTHWWSDTTGCSTAMVRSALASIGTSRVVYPHDESVARALAERLVAVLGGRATATGLAPNAFRSALLSGSEMAYVFPLRRMTVDRCRSMNELVERASWLGGRGAITALIDTRLHAVVRRDRLNLTFTWDSTVAIAPARP